VSVLIKKIKIKMKKSNLLSLLVLFSVLLFTSCSKDNDHSPECQECAALCAMDDGTTTEKDLGEFCGEDLQDIEANGYTLTSELVVGSVTYPVGHVFSASEICCAENHDGHNHK